MNLQKILNQYWRLILVMLLPARYVKWLGVLTLAVLVPGTLLYFFDISFVLYIGSALSLMLLMMVGMLVPGQMLALRSSKQFQCMADLRHYLFIIALCFWTSVSLILTVMMSFFEFKGFSFHSVFALTFMAVSCVALLFAVVGSYMQTAQGFVPMVVWILFFSAKSLDLFAEQNTGIYWAVSLLLWLVMFVWWFRWQPQKYLVNFMTLPAAEIQRLQMTNTQAMAAAFSSVPKTLAGSLLVGASDGIQAWCKRELGQLIFFVLMLAFVFYWVKQIPQNAAGFMVSIYLFIFICIRGSVIFQHIFRNLYRLWMNSSYSRTALLAYIEQRYFLLFIVSLLPAVLVIGLINHYLLGDVLSLFHLAYLLLIGLLICSLSFYLGLFIYLNTAASFLWLNWVSPIANIALIGLMVYFNILFGPEPSVEHRDYLAFSAGLLILVLAGRTWVKSRWHRVNFFRVKN
uniref:hypothetical protein n=1 Tax=Cellvibrio fontiphilus TaxID=1815559 RepID=UPI002B4C11E4|nr:hypothetical protein [Cellvibrio fontiphilus]